MPFVKQKNSREGYKYKFSLVNHLGNENGNVLVLVALLAAVLFGMTAMVIDGGMLYRERNILQKAVDAAALAGVQELYGKKNDTKEAEEVAKNYVQYNYDGLKGEGKVENLACSFSDDYYQITVNADINTDLWFARVISDKWKLPFNVSATATAIKSPGYGPMPLGIYKGTWDLYYPDNPKLGAVILLRKDGNDFMGNITSKPFSTEVLPGWFDMVGPDKNKSNITDYVSMGIPGCVGIGDTLHQLNGGTYGNVQPGFIERLERANNGVCRKHPKGCPDNPYHIIEEVGEDTGVYEYLENISAYDVYGLYKECPRLLLLPIIDSVPSDKKVFVITDFIIAYLKEPADKDKKTVEAWYLGKLTLSEGSPCLSSNRYARLIR